MAKKKAARPASPKKPAAKKGAGKGKSTPAKPSLPSSPPKKPAATSGSVEKAPPLPNAVRARGPSAVSLGKFVVANVPEVALFFGKSDTTIFKWLDRGCPGKRASPGQNDGRFDLKEMLAWCLRNVWEERRGKRPNLLDDEEMLYGGGDSPNLEEFRKWRAKIAQKQYEEKCEQVIDRQTVHDCLTSIAGILRQFGEQLQRTFGNEASDMLNETLVEAEAQIEAKFKRDYDESGDEDNPSEEEA